MASKEISVVNVPTFPFFALPPELRILIYKELLCPNPSPDDPHVVISPPEEYHRKQNTISTKVYC